MSRLSTGIVLSLGVCLFSVAVLLIINAVGNVYWPHNHEGLTPFIRTSIYVEHLKHGDVFPVWSVRDGDGLGSPLPAYYHKLFYLVSGGVGALGLSVRASVIFAIACFLTLGGIGLYGAARELGLARVASAAGAVMLLVAGYTTTNWLVRGAMAELSSAMLVPWLLLGLLRSTRLGRVSKVLGVSVGLMLAAHSVLAFYGALLSGAIILWAVLVGRVSLRPGLFWDSLPALLITALLALPSVGALMIFGGDYELSRINGNGMYTPRNQFVALERYFWDTTWSWGRAWDHYTVQIDSAVLVVALVGFAALIFRRPRMGERRFQWLVVAAIVVACAFLQGPWAVLFYETVPGAGFIQFPWRLLAFITPGLILVSLGTFSWISIPPMPTWGPIAMCLMMIATSGVLARIQYDGYLSGPDLSGPVSMSWAGEYVPVHAVSVKPMDSITLAATQECSVTRKGVVHEALVVRFVADCPASAMAVLPVFSSRWHRVRQGVEEWRPCVEAGGYPALCSIGVPAGRSEVWVAVPTILSIVWGMLGIV